MRAIESLFEKIRGLQREGLQFKVRASCVEIHNESVIDLVRFSRASKSCTPLPVKFDTASAAFFVHELSYCKCPTEEDLLRIYMRTLRNRSVAAHQLNRDSSRSHMLFTVYVDSMVKGADGHITTRHGKITFVDLAGSERLKESKSEGATLRETGAINKSLFTLGKVIASLCDRKRVRVPYRDSKLTQLLADSIGGTSLTLMLACVSPSDATLSETVSPHPALSVAFALHCAQSWTLTRRLLLSACRHARSITPFRPKTFATSRSCSSILSRTWSRSSSARSRPCGACHPAAPTRFAHVALTLDGLRAGRRIVRSKMHFSR